MWLDRPDNQKAAKERTFLCTKKVSKSFWEPCQGRAFSKFLIHPLFNSDVIFTILIDYGLRQDGVGVVVGRVGGQRRDGRRHGQKRRRSGNFHHDSRTEIANSQTQNKAVDITVFTFWERNLSELADLTPNWNCYFSKRRNSFALFRTQRQQQRKFGIFPQLSGSSLQQNWNRLAPELAS